MAKIEIKLNYSAFKAEVNDLRNAARGIEAKYVDVSGGGELSLDTVKAYGERFNGRAKDIYNTIKIFGMLVEKDTKDMDKIAEKLNAADMQVISETLNITYPKSVAGPVKEGK